VAWPFWVNAATTLGVIAALIWWRRPAAGGGTLPPETFVRAGLRHARYNPGLRAAMIRAAGFFVFASAYWALLPLVARDQVGAGPALYGLLLGAISAGAVGGGSASRAWSRRRRPAPLDSWIEHLRQHERVTKADSALQAEVNRFHVEGAPEVTHFLSRGESGAA